MPVFRSKAGQDVSIFCPNRGTPLPLVTWSKDGVAVELMPGRVELINDRQELRISTARLDDGGSYMCEVSNSIGNDSYTLELEVQGEPLLRALGGGCISRARLFDGGLWPGSVISLANFDMVVTPAFNQIQYCFIYILATRQFLLITHPPTAPIHIPCIGDPSQ